MKSIYCRHRQQDQDEMMEIQGPCYEENAVPGMRGRAGESLPSYMLASTFIRELHSILILPSHMTSHMVLASKYAGFGICTVVACGCFVLSGVGSRNVGPLSCSLCILLILAIVLFCARFGILRTSNISDTDSLDWPMAVAELQKHLKSVKEDRDRLADALIQAECDRGHLRELSGRRRIMQSRITCVLLEVPDDAGTGFGPELAG